MSSIKLHRMYYLSYLTWTSAIRLAVAGIALVAAASVLYGAKIDFFA